MIETSAVIATKDGFVVANKINKPQWVRDLRGETFLQRVTDGKSIGICVETKYYFIVASPHQKFIQDHKSYVRASAIQEGDEVLTSNGVEIVTRVLKMDGVHEMCNPETASDFFIANGFHLISD